MEDWNEEKAEYLQTLQNIFKDYIIEKEKSFNSFSYIYLAINRWYLSLPKCSRDMNRYYDSDTAIEKMREVNRKRFGKDVGPFLPPPIGNEGKGMDLKSAVMRFLDKR